MDPSNDAQSGNASSGTAMWVMTTVTVLAVVLTQLGIVNRM